MEYIENRVGSRLQAHYRWHFHFLSLSSGEPHPLAADFTLSDPPPSLRQSGRLQLHVAGNYVAALLSTYQLTICDWKTGQTVLVRPRAHSYTRQRVKLTSHQSITSSDIQSMAFLPENRILVASTRVTELVCGQVPDSIARGPVLAVFNLDATPLAGHQQATQIPIVIFVLELGRDILPFDMHLHYRPNTHSYSPEVAVPFFSSPADHIIALELTNHLRFPYSREPVMIPIRQIVLIPIAKLLYQVGIAEKEGTCCVLQWNDWAATGICRVPAPSPSLCRNAVSGSRFIPHPQSCNVVGLWDFSRAQARVAQTQSSVFESVPCDRKEVALPASISGSVTAALSEDVIVIHEASIVASSIRPLIYIQPPYIHRLSRPRRRGGFIFSSSEISSAGVKQGSLGRATLLITILLSPPHGGVA